MTRTPRLVPRLATVAALTLAAAGALAAAPGSYATTPPTPELMTTAQADTGNSADCTATGGLTDDTADSDYTLGHAGVTSLSNHATLQNNTVANDTTTVSSSSTTHVTSTLTGGVFSTMHVTGSATSTIDAALGTSTDCEPEATAAGGVEFTFTIGQPRWVTTTTTTTSRGLVELVLGAEDDSTSNFDIDVAKGTKTSHFYLAPNTYTAVLAAGVGNNGFFGSTDFTGNGTSHTTYTLAMTLTKPGTATTGVQGDKKVATLPATISCTSHKATIKWGKNAAKAGKATVKINGKKPKTTKKPKSGKTHVVSGLPGTGPVTLSVKAGSKTVSRTYEACA